MKSLLRRRPSPALVISLIALFVSLSGVSYGVATGFIDGREIKNNEVRSIDLRNNTIRSRDLRNNEVRGLDIRNSTIQTRDIGLNQVTGEDVREDSLGKVPSAAAADMAASATNATSAESATTAGSVGGTTFRKFSYAGQLDSAFVGVLSFGGLTLEARCAGGPGPFLEVRANPTVANSELSSDFPGFNNDDLNFNPGDNAIVVDNPGDGTGVLAFAAPDGRVVTVQAMTRQDMNGVAGTTNDCGFFGIAQAG